jgi:rod shape-determining protein MreD
MIYAIGIPALALASILQSSVVNQVRLLNGRPDLVLLLLICLALYYRIRPTLVLAFFGGIFLDLFSGLPLGVTSIELLIVFFMISFTEDRFWKPSILIIEIITLASSVLFHLMGAGLSMLTGSSLAFMEVLTRIILPSTFLNMLLVLPLAYISNRIWRLQTENGDPLV